MELTGFDFNYNSKSNIFKDFIYIFSKQLDKEISKEDISAFVRRNNLLVQSFVGEIYSKVPFIKAEVGGMAATSDNISQSIKYFLVDAEGREVHGNSGVSLNLSSSIRTNINGSNTFSVIISHSCDSQERIFRLYDLIKSADEFSRDNTVLAAMKRLDYLRSVMNTPDQGNLEKLLLGPGI